MKTRATHHRWTLPLPKQRRSLILVTQTARKESKKHRIAISAPLPMMRALTRWSAGWSSQLPFKLACALVEHPLLAVDAHDAIFEGAFPLVLDPLHLVVRT